MTDKTPDTETDAGRETSASPERPDGSASAETSAGAASPDSDAAASAAGPEPIPVSPGVHKRLTTGLGGFTLAMGVCVLLAMAIYAVTPRADEQVLPTVDYASHLWVMKNDAPYTVHAPEGLPAGWRPTSSRVHGLDAPEGEKPVAWHLGFVTPSDEYAALEQSNEKASEYVPRMANSSQPLGTMQVAGATWKKYHRDDKHANSLARTLPSGISLVVVGTATYEELAVLAGSLKPQKKGGGLTSAQTPASPSAP